MSIQRAKNPKGTGNGVENQDTRYLYESVYNSGMVTNTIYPDSTDTDATGTDQVKTSYDRLGRSVTMTDQRGVQHTYSYDTAGRLLSDAVTVLPAGVDGAIRRIEYGYDDQSRVQTVTSYDAATAGNIVNQIAYSYDGWGNLIQSRQSHAGAVTSTTPGVTYTYADGAVNGAARYVRLVTVTYPNGRTVGYDYGTTGSADDRLSRIAALTEGSNTPVATYTYLGTGTIIASARPQATNGLTLTLGNAANDYAGLDRFGRTVSLQWQDDTNTNVDAYGYSYDRNSNRITKSNLLNSNLDEAYTYDSLNRLTATTRGGTAYQDWSLDSLGNMNSVTTGGTTETRTHNAANELEGLGANTLVNDAAGNTTTDDQGQHLTYDAWNRLTQVRDASDNVLVTYQYDGQNRRIVADLANAAGGAQDLYYTEGWQLIEVRNSGNTAVTTQYLWGIRYTDDLILRDQDANSNGSFEAGERLYALQDANFNVTAIADSAGSVVERFVNDPYGKFVVLSNTWTATTDAYQWQHHHQGLLYQATTSLYWNRNRDYSPTMQRFTGADPLVYVDGMSRFNAVRNNPIVLHDYLGLDPLAPKVSDKVFSFIVLETKVRVEIEPISNNIHLQMGPHRGGEIKYYYDDVNKTWNPPLPAKFAKAIEKNQLLKQKFDTKLASATQRLNAHRMSNTTKACLMLGIVFSVTRVAEAANDRGLQGAIDVGGVEFVDHSVGYMSSAIMTPMIGYCTQQYLVTCATSAGVPALTVSGGVGIASATAVGGAVGLAGTGGYAIGTLFASIPTPDGVSTAEWWGIAIYNTYRRIAGD